MLDKFKKYFSNSATADNTQEEAMSLEKDQAATALDTTAVANLTAQLSTVNDAMATLQEQFTTLSSKYEAAQKALNASEAATALLATQAAEKRLKERTEAITHAVGTAKVASMLAATDSLDDVQFNTIVSAMATNLDKEAEGKMFSSQGVAAEAPSLVEPDAVARLAAALAK